MRYLVAVVMLTSLQGCWFVFFPLPKLNSSDAGNTCIRRDYFTGDKIKNESGNTGVVKRVYGTSDRCRNAAYPILADVEY